MNQVPAVLDEPKHAPAVSGFEMKPRTLEEAMRFCEIMADSELVPKDFKGKPGNIMVAIQMGMELGLSPMRALKSIAVINGRASMWGDELLAMVLNSPLCEYVDESESTEQKGVCRVKRKTDPKEHVSTFTLEDAKRAGLLGKQGPWQTSTKRMLQLRARGFALRDKFADVLAGLVTTEEAMDIPADQPVTTQVEQPKTLKDKLKAKVEADHAGAAGGATPVTEPAAADALPAAGAPALPDSDDPAEPYRAKLRTCGRNPKAINETYYAIPEELRQDCHAEYTEQLRSLSKK